MLAVGVFSIVQGGAFWDEVYVSGQVWDGRRRIPGDFGFIAGGILSVGQMEGAWRGRGGDWDFFSSG